MTFGRGGTEDQEQREGAGEGQCAQVKVSAER